MSSTASAAPPARRTRSRPPSASSRRSEDPSSAAAANANGNGKTSPSSLLPTISRKSLDAFTLFSIGITKDWILTE
ncbi:hypothetical protein ZWY2020_019717, partial [Hordeum vulgare]